MTDGAAAVVMCSAALAQARGARAVRVLASVLQSSDHFYRKDDLTSFDAGKRVAGLAYEMAGIGPKDLDVVELHDAFAPEELVQRLTGRWVCPRCARSYHMENNPPKDDMRCNVDATGLVHRDDDTEETARRRSEVFYQRTYPILAFYKQRGISVEIDGHGSIGDVRERVREALAGSTKGAA